MPKRQPRRPFTSGRAPKPGIVPPGPGQPLKRDPDIRYCYMSKSRLARATALGAIAGETSPSMGDALGVSVSDLDFRENDWRDIAWEQWRNPAARKMQAVVCFPSAGLALEQVGSHEWIARGDLALPAGTEAWERDPAVPNGWKRVS